MQNLISRRVDLSAVRVHFAAKLVAFHCTQGKQNFFIRPLLNEPVFNYYFSPADHKAIAGKELAAWVINLWPEEKLDDLKLFPILQLLRRHNAAEQQKILEILGTHYGLRL